jgi:gluconokinase/shikimate kinase
LLDGSDLRQIPSDGRLHPLAVKGLKPLVLVLISGSGKTTVGAILASRLGRPFQDGDALQPQSNVEKMRARHPLTDFDRWPWLEMVAEWIQTRLDRGENGLIACSALKRSYRDLLNRRGSGVVFVFLAGSKETIASRLVARHDHFMPPSMLDSQFADLEEPSSDEPAIRVDVGPTPDVIAQDIMQELRLSA